MTIPSTNTTSPGQIALDIGLITKLLDWEVFMGGFDSPVWSDLKRDVRQFLCEPVGNTGKPRTAMICPHCGTTSCGSDATANWSPLDQQWVLGSTFDDLWCNDCGDISELQEIELDDRFKDLCLATPNFEHADRRGSTFGFVFELFQAADGKPFVLQLFTTDAGAPDPIESEQAFATLQEAEDGLSLILIAKSDADAFHEIPTTERGALAALEYLEKKRADLMQRGLLK